MSCGPYRKIEVVNVPGVAGTNGVNCFTFTMANFTVPAVGSLVTVTVADALWMDAGQYILIGGPANFQVNSVISSTQVSLEFLGNIGDVATGTVISAGTSVVVNGRQGTNGQNCCAVTQYSFLVPTVGNTVTVPVNYSGCFNLGEYVITSGPANFLITALPSSTQMTLQFLGNTNDVLPGTTVSSGSAIGPAGKQGINSFTTLSAQITIPAVGSTVTALVGSSQWMANGQKVVISGPATFQVTGAPVAPFTSVVLTFLGYVGDLSPGNTLPNNSTVSPSGTQPQIPVIFSSASTTPYTLTTTPTSIGVSLTISTAGTYRITARVNLQYDDAYEGFASANAVTLTINRTNNTPTQLGQSVVYPDAVQTAHTVIETFVVNVFEVPSYTTAATTDLITIQASFANALVAGNILAVEMTLIAMPA
jgi:hypothetical protein